MTVTYRDFIHPEDDRARRELEAVPGFDTVTKCFMKFGVEKFLHGSLMANCIRLSPTQLPEMYGLLPPVARKFGIAEPEFYLQMDPSPNACTMGDETRFLVITSGLLQYIRDPKERESVIAHECGHIVCRHVFYLTMAHLLMSVGSSIGIPSALFAPITLALNYWLRRSELSADRASAAYLGDPAPVMRSLLRLTGGPHVLTESVNMDEYAKQADDYYKLLEDSKWHKLLQSLAVMNANHPFSAVRVREVSSWCGNEAFRRLCAAWKDGLEGVICRSCGKPIARGDRFCCHCGRPAGA